MAENQKPQSTALDGSKTTVRAETLSYVIGSVHAFDLTNGQTIDFERMKRFEVLKAENENTQGAKADILITLLNGKTVTGKINAGLGYDLFGFNDMGRFNTTLQRIKRIDFER